MSNNTMLAIYAVAVIVGWVAIILLLDQLWNTFR